MIKYQDCNIWIMITFILKTNIPLENHFGFPQCYFLTMYKLFSLEILQGSYRCKRQKLLSHL